MVSLQLLNTYTIVLSQVILITVSLAQLPVCKMATQEFVSVQKLISWHSSYQRME